MSSGNDELHISIEEDDEFLKVMHLHGGICLGMVLKTAIDLDLFQLMAKAGPVGVELSASEIASLLPTQNPQASVMLDRILRFLASYSVLKCSVVASDNEGGEAKRLYSLTPVCKHYISDEDGVSLSPFLLLRSDKVFMETWYHLKDALLEGGNPFERAHGTHAFEYPMRDARFNEVFNKGMFVHTKLVMNKFLKVYKGFDGIHHILDVGGGHGASLACIVSMYPNIRGINFDLPHVIKKAPPYQGIEHIEGDMFEIVPRAEVIFMKWILHDWSDDQCLKILKNCWEALPENGKLIVVESILPQYPHNDRSSNVDYSYDMLMMAFNPGGKERTHEELQTITKKAGFLRFTPICRAYNYWVIEIFKS